MDPDVSTELVDPAAVDRASERAEAIRTHVGEAWRLLAEAYAEQDWKAMGYVSFVEYGKDQFGMSERSIGRVLVWSQVQGALETAAGQPLPDLTQRQAEAVEAELPKVLATVRKARQRADDAAEETSVVAAAERAVERATNTRKSAGQKAGARAEKVVIPATSTEVAERPPTNRALMARVLAPMQDADPDGVGPTLTASEATFVRQWADRTVKAWQASVGVAAEPESPKRSPGRVITPADRAAAKLASAPAKIDPALCEHPKEKRRKLPYMTLCDDCGGKVA